MVSSSFILVSLSKHHLRVIALFRLARGSILASVIRIMPGGPLRIAALYVSGLFGVFYVVIVAQYIWVCVINEELNDAGYVAFSGLIPHIRLAWL
jgi:hypothetical protein